MKAYRSKFNRAGGQATEKALSDPAVMFPFKPLSAAFLEDAQRRYLEKRKLSPRERGGMIIKVTRVRSPPDKDG